MDDREFEEAVETERVEMAPMTVERFNRMNEPQVRYGLVNGKNVMLQAAGHEGVIPDDCIYAVSCGCGWFGMRDDCLQGRCPNCGDRPNRDKTEVRNDSI